MSVVHKKLHRTGESPDSWYLRIASGDTYGPVTLSVLSDWAAQLRIVPGNEVSQDGETWMLAEEVPELKMVWYAELPDGRTYGPFNVLAVPNLFNDGTIPAEAKLTNSETGKSLMVHELLAKTVEIRQVEENPQDDKPAKIRPKTQDNAQKEKDKLFQEKDAKWEKLYHEEKRARMEAEAAMQEKVEQLTREIGVLEAGLKEAAGKANAANSSLDDELKRIHHETEARENGLKAALEKAVGESNLKTELLEKAKREIEEARIDGSKSAKKDSEERLELERQLKKMDVLLTERQKDLDSLSEQRDRELGELNKALAEQKKLCENLRAEGEKKEDDFEKKLAEAARTYADISFETENLRKQLATQRTLYAKIEEKSSARDIQLLKQVQAANQGREELEKRVYEEQQKAQALEKELKQKEERFEKNLIKAEEKAKDGEEQLSVEKERIDFLNNTVKALQGEMDSEINRLNGELKALKKSAETEAKQISSEAEKRVHEIRDEKDSLEATLNQRIAELEKVLNDTSKDVVETRRSSAELENKAAEQQKKYEREIESLKELASRLESDLNAAQAAAAARGESMEAIRAGFAAREAERDATIEKLKNEYEEAAARAESISGELADERNRLEESRGRSEDEKKALSVQIEEFKKNADGEADSLRARIKELNGSLEEEKARNEMLLKEELHKSDELKKRMTEMEREIQAEASLLAQANERYEQSQTLRVEMEGRLNEEDSTLRGSLLKACEENANLREHIQGLEANLGEQTKTLESRTKEFGESKAELERTIAQLESKIEESVRAEDEIRARCDEQDRELTALNARLANQRQEYDRKIFEFEESVVSEESLLSEARRQLERERRESSAVKSDYEKTIDELKAESQKTIEKERSEFEKRIQNIEHTLASESEKVGNLNARLAEEKQAHKQSVKAAREKEGILQKSLRSAQDDIKKLEQALEAVESRTAGANDAWVVKEAQWQDNINSAVDASAAAEQKLREKTAQCEFLESELKDKKNLIKDSQNKLELLEKQSDKAEKSFLKKISQLESEVSGLQKATNKDGMHLRLGAKKGTGFVLRLESAVRDMPALSMAIAGICFVILCSSVFFVIGRHGAGVADFPEETKGPFEKVQGSVPEAVPVAVAEKPATAMDGDDSGLLKEAPNVEDPNLVMMTQLAARKDPGGPDRTTAIAPETAKEPAAPVAVKWPKINVDGLVVKQEKDRCIMIFEEGIFTYMRNVSVSGMRILEEFSKQLKGSMLHFTLTVRGHTDSVPVSSQASFNSNYELGLARAKRVSDILQQNYGLPGASIMVTSAGDQDPPYANDTEENRRRNRTVVLILTPGISRFHPPASMQE